MGHFSDYTYLQRGVHDVFLFLYFVWSLWRADKFSALSIHRIRRFELKSIVCVLMLIAFPLEVFYDFTQVRITYDEGYIVNPADGKIYVKPQEYWTPQDQSTVVYTDYTFDFAFSLEASILFLLQCFWNYLAKSITKKTFMSSWEWKIYLVWAAISLVLFPVLQAIFDAAGNSLYAEVFPQMCYGIEALIIAILGLLSHLRFNELISGYESSKRQIKNDIIVSKLSYFREMNAALSICLCLSASMVLMLCFDALTPAKTLNSSKEITDVAICIANVCGLVIWYILISIFFPSRTFSTNTSQHAITSTDEMSALPMTTVKTNGRVSQNHLTVGNVGRSASVSGNNQGSGIVKTVTIEVDEVGSQEDMTPLQSGTYYPA